MRQITKEEYALAFGLSGCENRFCAFKFYNGRKEKGVITTFFPEDLLSFQLVKAADLKRIKPYMDANDWENMKRYAKQVDIADIHWATTLNWQKQ